MSYVEEMHAVLAHNNHEVPRYSVKLHQLSVRDK